ncbi:hypothetical protein [Streptomyces sp. NPDC014744]|uniref:hypothetical protein n=1 Tax=Streptomyces sp. NPDC014744 TaxID=3364903 RepID=UPI0036FFA875
MRKQVLINFNSPITQEARDTLIAKGAKRGDIFTAWRLPTDRIPVDLEESLRNIGASYCVFFEYLPTAEDAPGNVAAYLWLDYFEDLRASGSESIFAYRRETSSIVASVPLAAEVKDFCNGSLWKRPKDLEGFFELAEVPTLPEPVIVQRAVSLAEGPDGKWGVQSDGRELLTRTNMETVAKSGIVQTVTCTVVDGTLKWTRPLIFCGRLLELLKERHVTGLEAFPVYLGLA